MAAKPIKRVLIANRGEIAVRVIRCLREMGIESVVVYSDPDARSQARRIADYAIPLHGTTPAETYLNIPKIMAALKESGADAVHPGYGFLSENDSFARTVRDSGATFIGPSPESMGIMGNKVEAKKLMRRHQVPVTPGSIEPLSSLEELRALTSEFGFPMILKAAHGGGGRGMRVVRSDADLQAAFEATVREATAYFGNPEVFCERYIENPRHIEVQVMCDSHGNGIYLFERDCSIQRRHQKLIEEAPSKYLDESERHRLGRIAVTSALAAGYEGAGTVEFICEGPGRAYFMEMNTRIQVEHPVTEMITGIDLIREQLRVAQGETLSVRQEDLVVRGWAIEARINAEDPVNNFAPTPGLITQWQVPQGPFVRVDTHVYQGFEVSAAYDSMIAKVIAWGRDREEAIQRLTRALAEIEVRGVPTTARFHEAVLAHRDFRAGEFNTGWVEAHLDELKEVMVAADASSLDAASILAAILVQEQGREETLGVAGARDKWKAAGRLSGVGRHA